MKNLESPFTYLAFDQDMDLLIAHGSTAIEALDRADSLAPDAAIQIIYARDLGERIWQSALNLEATIQITNGFTNLLPRLARLPPIRALWI